MHGAFLSGQREAAKIVNELDMRPMEDDPEEDGEVSLESLLAQADGMQRLFELGNDVEFGSFAAM
eukprot:scaffold98645_cov53-Prasinocladus_malaysianus.AAC.1